MHGQLFLSMPYYTKTEFMIPSSRYSPSINSTGLQIGDDLLSHIERTLKLVYIYLTLA